MVRFLKTLLLLVSLLGAAAYSWHWGISALDSPQNRELPPTFSGSEATFW